MTEPIIGDNCGFIFADGTDDCRGLASIVVRVPRGIRSKKKLFAIYADKLRFPGYFGWNWDAFEECLCDLSWIPSGRSIAIVHEDLPFGPGGVNRSIYLKLLRNSLDHWSALGGRSVKVVLPVSYLNSFSPTANAQR